VAIGKLRRLTYLSLRLCDDGRGYEAMGRGLAASGGCPLLSELRLDDVKSNIDWLLWEPSLIVPSVHRLTVSYQSRHYTDAEGLLFCCGLVRTGFTPLPFCWGTHVSPVCLT
jgi:hypothetical protein